MSTAAEMTPLAGATAGTGLGFTDMVPVECCPPHPASAAARTMSAKIAPRPVGRIEWAALVASNGTLAGIRNRGSIDRHRQEVLSGRRIQAEITVKILKARTTMRAKL